MGFIDWIVEPAAEAWGQHVDAVQGEQRAPLQKIPCPYCSSEFDSARELCDHTRLDHPLRLPLLLINEKVALSEVVIRSPIAEDHIIIQSCDQITLAKGEQRHTPVSEQELVRALARAETGRIRIRLRNKRASDGAQATSDHTLDFRIADEREMARIERKFTATMRANPIGVPAAKEFWDACGLAPDRAGARDYADALANYIIGLAIKEGGGESGGTRLPFESYKEKIMGALDVTGQFPSPLAKAVTQVIRFMLNDFNDWQDGGAALPGLFRAARFFSAPAEGLRKPMSSQMPALQTSGKCPVDDLTERIVDAAGHLVAGRFRDSTLNTLLPPLLQWDPLPEYDRQKIHAMMAALEIGRQEHSKARPHLRALRSDPVFGGWAESELEK